MTTVADIERIVTTQDDAFILARLEIKEEFKAMSGNTLSRALTSAIALARKADDFMDKNNLISAHRMLIGVISTVEAVIYAIEKPDEGD